MLALAFFRNLTERSGVKFLKKGRKTKQKAEGKKERKIYFGSGGCYAMHNKIKLRVRMITVWRAFPTSIHRVDLLTFRVAELAV